MTRLLLSTIAALGLLACSEGSPPTAAKRSREATPPARSAPAPTEPVAAPAELTPAELVAKGKQSYMSNCIACHNTDPAKAGALGPAVAGSSLELLEARVLHGVYPPGYTPKADTRAMVAMPFLKDQIPALAAYLQSVGG